MTWIFLTVYGSLFLNEMLAINLWWDWVFELVIPVLYFQSLIIIPSLTSISFFVVFGEVVPLDIFNGVIELLCFSNSNFKDENYYINTVPTFVYDADADAVTATPMTWPELLITGPPLLPGDIGAVIWIKLLFSKVRIPLTIPSEIVPDSPLGFPIA